MKEHGRWKRKLNTCYYVLRDFCITAKCFICVISLPQKPYKKDIFITTITSTLLIKKWSARRVGSFPGAAQLEGAGAPVREQFSLTLML